MTLQPHFCAWVMTGVLLALGSMGCQSKDEAVVLACDSPNQVDAQLPPQQRGLALAVYINTNVKNKEILSLVGGAEPAAIRGERLQTLATSMGIDQCPLADLWKKAESPSRLPLSALPPAGSAPAGPAAHKGIQIIGTLPISEVTKTLEEASPALERCYVTGLEKDKKLAGVLRIRFNVDEEGKPSQVEQQGTNFDDADVVACIVEEIGKLHFANEKKEKATVLFPMLLQPMVKAAASADSAASANPPPSAAPADSEHSAAPKGSD